MDGEIEKKASFILPRFFSSSPFTISLSMAPLLLPGPTTTCTAFVSFTIFSSYFADFSTPSPSCLRCTFLLGSQTGFFFPVFSGFSFFPPSLFKNLSYYEGVLLPPCLLPSIVPQCLGCPPRYCFKLLFSQLGRYFFCPFQGSCV